MAHGVIDLAKRIGVLVVCEGVECLELVEILKQMGCDLIQGYIYAKPIPRAILKIQFSSQVIKKLRIQ